MSSMMPVDILQNSMVVGQQRQQISEPQFNKFPYSTIIFGLEDTIQKLSDNLFCFSIGSNVCGSKKWKWLFHEELKSSRSVSGISQILRC